MGGISVTYKTVWQYGPNGDQAYAKQSRRPHPGGAGDPVNSYCQIGSAAL
jgi:hypothetical protein